MGRAGFSGCPVRRWLGFKRQRQRGQPVRGGPSALSSGLVAVQAGSDNEVGVGRAGFSGCPVDRWLRFGRAATTRSACPGWAFGFEVPDARGSDGQRQRGSRMAGWALRLPGVEMVAVRAGGGEEVPLAWGWVGWLPVRVGCGCRAWGWARTRWGFELGGVARRRAGGAPFPPRPGDCPGAGTLRTADRRDRRALRVWVVWAALVRVPVRWARLGSSRPLLALRSVLGIGLSRLSWRRGFGLVRRLRLSRRDRASCSGTTPTGRARSGSSRSHPPGVRHPCRHRCASPNTHTRHCRCPDRPCRLGFRGRRGG